jgi:hypothetical protein
VNATPQISGAASAHSPSTALAADSSLAGFLLASPAASADQDFRSIAAAMFGAASTPANPAPTTVKDPVVAKKAVSGLAENELETRKSKAIADPASPAVAHPELTVPPLNIPAPSLRTMPQQIGGEQVAPTPDAMPEPLDPSPLSARLEHGAPPVDRAKTASNTTPLQTANDAALNEQFALSQTPSTTTPIPPAKQQGVKGPANVEGANLRKMPSAAGDDPLTQPAMIGDGVKQGQEAAAQIASIPIISATAKKSTGDRSQGASVGGTAKNATTQATNVDKPTISADVSATARPSYQVPTVVPDSTPLASAPGQTSALPVNTIVDASAANSLQQPRPVAPDSKSGRGAMNTQAKIKDRNPDRTNNDLSDKDTRLSAAQDGKSVLDQFGRNAAGPANLSTGNNKDAADLALQNHSGAHTKPAPLKDSAGTPSSSTIQTDADGPDEVPTSASSTVATAKLVQGMSQSEFRVGMQSQEFGSIDIRTSVARHMFSAQISVEHSDMAKSLTADLPALYHKLADQQVPVASIVIHGQNLATSSGLSQDAQPRSWRPQSQAVAKLDAEPVLPAMAEALDAAGRLDIRI